MRKALGLTLEFQSTPPSQGATYSVPPIEIKYSFQSTLPSQGATEEFGELATFVQISIHAPLSGSDQTRFRIIHDINRFQSTLPSQGATLQGRTGMNTCADFNPRSPLRERPNWIENFDTSFIISIHAPLAGSDRLQSQNLLFSHYFNPRSPRRERRPLVIPLA